MEVEKYVLDSIVPTQDEQRRIEKAARDLAEEVEAFGKEYSLKFDPILVGSIAKGTHLKNPDIDLFLRFPSSLPKERIGEIDAKIGRALLDRPEERYAEHPYISGYWQGFRTDLVPCYDVPSGKGRISAVDRTPFHTDYVKAHLKEGKRNEVRLFKQFTKGIGVYGAEAKIRGFSGYLCEIMVLKFGSFRGIVEAARRWKPPVEIDLEGKGSKRFGELFVFVDPVDPGRNVASPVSAESLVNFIDACKAYSKSPSEQFFFPKELADMGDKAMEKCISESRGTVLVELPHLDVVDDVLWPQLRKTGVSMFELLDREGFAPVKLTLDSRDDMNLIVIGTSKDELPPTRIHNGPPEDSAEASNFIRKWTDVAIAGPVVKKGRWQVEIERRERTPKDVLTKELRQVRMGKGFRGSEGRIVTGDALMVKKYRATLTKHFDERRPWER